MGVDFKKVSKLGFGCMRFEGHETDSIDIEYTSKLIDTYISYGGNYFDTAWAYPNSEAALRKALVERYPRDSFFIADKCVAWTHCESTEDLERQMQESLQNLGVDYFDVYLMHNVGGKRTAAFDKYNAWEFVKSVKARGLAKSIGFSAHCMPDELEELIQKYPGAEVVQLQINYLDWENLSFKERECVEVANKHGLPIIAMEPVKGGLLADPSEKVKEILDETMPGSSYAVDALRFVASQPGVVSVLSGMSTLEQVEDNARAFENFQPLSPEEAAGIERAQRAQMESGIVPCTACDYCAKVCPQDIGISSSISVLNYFINFKDPVSAGDQMGFVVGLNAGKKLPSECIRCGACMDACPQNIDILGCFDRIATEIMPYKEPPQILMRP